MNSTEYLVFRVNADGDRAKTASLVTHCSLELTIHLAKVKLLKPFNVIERANSEEGFSDQCVHMER